MREELPPSAQIGYNGESREFKQSGDALLHHVRASRCSIVYLVLAAQFESFIHPLVIMLTVPLGVTGALLGLWLHRRHASTSSARSAASC